jgi:hypothetical protein
MNKKLEMSFWPTLWHNGHCQHHLMNPKIPTMTSPSTKHYLYAYGTQRCALFCNNPPVIEGFDEQYMDCFRIATLAHM